MELIDRFSKIVTSDFTTEEIFQRYGNFKIRIGNNIILEPITKEVIGLKIGVNDENKIVDVSFTSSKAIPFEELKNMINDYHVGYNYYDEMTILSFVLHDNIMVNAKVNGYIHGDKIFNSVFSEFEIKTK